MARSVAARVAAWDGVCAAVREALRGQGLSEVTTPVRLDAVALEPWIEPVAAEGGWLATSPELPMKRLLCRGAPPIFQIAHCFRASERGATHREEFHLVEWYRHGEDIAPVCGDVERLWDAAARAVARLEGSSARPLPWRTIAWLDLWAQTTGLSLRGDEDLGDLREALARVSAPWVPALAEHEDETSADMAAVLALEAWTALLSAWSDACLDPWLRSLGRAGVHVVDFPAPLAALAQTGVDATGRAIAHRFESYLVLDGRTLELANGYRELRDAREQTRRFDVVAQLRARHGLPARPRPDAFLADLRGWPLPACAGAALGLDRLVLAACGESDLAAVDIHFGAPR
jgi:lysyl-tRNA synthetase class 2